MTGSERVRRAFGTVRRRDFLPPGKRAFADQDRALEIGYGQTNSQPSTVRRMLELLEVQPGQRILDVGCGSGWTTALLGALVGPAGEVVGVERVDPLVTWGRENLRSYPMPWTSIAKASPDVLGLPDRAPYDRILVSAEAGSLPADLLNQLVVGGVMVVPVRGRMNVVRRTKSQPVVELDGHYSFVPLIEPGHSSADPA